MLAQTVGNVLHQEYAPIEHIIVDGGSTDDTRQVLSKYRHLKTISEPDQGMYDALNKGLRIARGEIIGFLNTDDLYPDGALDEVADRFTKTGVDAVAGQAIYFLKKGDNSTSFFRRTKLITDQTLWRSLTYGDPAFNAWFFRRRVFDRIGNFDAKYHIAGDRDFLIRFALSGLRHANLEKVVYQYQVHAESMTMSQDLLQFSRIAEENLQLMERYAALVPAKARAYIRRARTTDTITAASRNLRGGAYKKALHFMQFGWRHDLLWPIKFLLRLFTGIFRAVGRKFGMYPPI
jgi:glycosyltransferase involved in cell wall biosynthesis